MANGRLIQSKFAALRIYKFALKFGFLAKFFAAKFMLGFVGVANLAVLLVAFAAAKMPANSPFALLGEALK